MTINEFEVCKEALRRQIDAAHASAIALSVFHRSDALDRTKVLLLWAIDSLKKATVEIDEDDDRPRSAIEAHNYQDDYRDDLQHKSELLEHLPGLETA